MSEESRPRRNRARHNAKRPVTVAEAVSSCPVPGVNILTGRKHMPAEELAQKKTHYSQKRIETERKAGVKCKHCVARAVNRPRGLCWTCYYTPGVREMYTSGSKFARRGVGNFTGEAPLPAVPTTAAPGTPEKLLVLEQRAKKEQALFHPADARFQRDLLPVEWLEAEHKRLQVQLPEPERIAA